MNLNIENILKAYIIINVLGMLLMVFFAIPISNLIEEMCSSIKVRHLLLTPLILLFLPWFILLTLIHLFINYVEYLGTNEFLNKDIITFNRGGKKDNGC